MLSESCEGLSKVVDMVSHARAFDHHVIDVGLHFFVELFGKNFIDHPLVGSSSILQPEGHYLVAVSPSVNHEGYFFFIFLCHSDLIVTQEGIYKRHQLKPQGGIHKLVDAGKGVAIFGTGSI